MIIDLKSRFCNVINILLRLLRKFTQTIKNQINQAIIVRIYRLFY